MNVLSCCTGLEKVTVTGSCAAAVRMQQMHGKAHTGHICHSVQRTHLMKMDLTDRHPMGQGFCMGNAVVNALGSQFYFIRSIQRR